MSYTVALGPFASQWRNPQRLVLQVEGDTVTDVEYRTGYNERGCAERLPQLGLDPALHLVSRVCGTCSHAHSLAYCQAIEALLDIDVPPRAAYLRTLIAELERAAAHLESLHVLFDLLGQQQVAVTLQATQRDLRELMTLASGAPAMPNVCMPGGLKRNPDRAALSDLLALLSRVTRQLFRLTDSIIDQRALLARTVDVGVLTHAAAGQYVLGGPLARASGHTHDLRIDEPYAAYAAVVPRAVTQDGGDVYARLVVLLLEALESLKLVEQAVQELPEGEWEGAFPPRPRAGHAESAVEAPHGILRYRIESNGQRITTVMIEPPRQFDRLLARTLLSNALLDNAPLIIQSTAPCPACAEA